MKITEKEDEAWTEFNRAANTLVRVLGGHHAFNNLILNDIDHHAQRVREALDASRYFWRHDLKRARPGAIVLDPPN